MQEVLELGSRVKRVGGGYRDETYDADELLQLGAEEVLLLREALESARRDAQWARRELDEERGQHSLAHKAVLSAARLEAEELRSQLAEMETQLDRSAFSVRVLGEKSEKAMELLAIKAEKEAEMEVALRRAEAEAAASAGGAALAQIKAEHAARSQQIADEVRTEIAALGEQHVASIHAEHEHGALLAQRLACQHRAALALLEVLPASDLEPPSFRREHPSEPEPLSEADQAPRRASPPRTTLPAAPAVPAAPAAAAAAAAAAASVPASLSASPNAVRAESTLSLLGRAMARAQRCVSQQRKAEDLAEAEMRSCAEMRLRLIELQAAVRQAEHGQGREAAMRRQLLHESEQLVERGKHTVVSGQ